jgi:hypothetical protein
VSPRAVSRHCGIDGCRAWAVRGSEPLRCAAHGGASSPVGAPKGNKNRQTHGAYAAPVEIHDISDVVSDLQRKMGKLSAMIDGCEDPELVLRLMGLHSQMASRLGRLERDKRALDGKAADSLLQAIGKALDEISTELGIRL